MKCTTLQYIHSLKVLCDNLREIITILGPIRVDSDEGANGLKVGKTNVLKLLNIYIVTCAQHEPSSSCKFALN